MKEDMLCENFFLCKAMAKVFVQRESQYMSSDIIKFVRDHQYGKSQQAADILEHVTNVDQDYDKMLMIFNWINIAGSTNTLRDLRNYIVKVLSG